MRDVQKEFFSTCRKMFYSKQSRSEPFLKSNDTTKLLKTTYIPEWMYVVLIQPSRLVCVFLD